MDFAKTLHTSEKICNVTEGASQDSSPSRPRLIGVSQGDWVLPGIMLVSRMRVCREELATAQRAGIVISQPGSDATAADDMPTGVNP